MLREQIIWVPLLSPGSQSVFKLPIDRQLSRDWHRGAILRVRLRWSLWECIELPRLQQAGDRAE